MKLLFEYGQNGAGLGLLPALDVPAASLPKGMQRTQLPRIPNLSEAELSRHYTQLENETFGVNDGFYPLGSCTMKYNPKINNEVAGYEGFTDIHPLQPSHTVQGCLEVLHTAEHCFCQVTGMDAMSFQPAAGAHGEYTGLLLIRQYHESRGDAERTKIIVPDSSHGTNPASATMANFKVVSVATRPDGCVDLEALRGAVGPDTAGLMLTNPNTLGLFEKDIVQIAEIVHAAGGLVYYDGANLNPIMAVARPGDMGFDVIHLNLHKTFSTPHGGGGPGSGPVGCKALLQGFLPVPRVCKDETGYRLDYDMPQSIGSVKAFYGNFLVTLRALTYLLTLGQAGMKAAAQNAVLNANYLMNKLKDVYEVAYPGVCMHEFVLSLEGLKRDFGVSAKDISKAMLDYRMHPPTMYFPINVHEALMFEPTETESKQTLDEAAAVLIALYEQAKTQPETLTTAPHNTTIGRPDEVAAARRPILRYEFEAGL